MEYHCSKSLKMHEACKVGPASALELSLPLTFFDLLWFKFHPSERIFFYSLPHHSHSHHSHTSFFFDTLIPKLKYSLSLTLQHFIPLAGTIVWPSNSQKPFLHYTPGNGVSLVIAEFDADFDHLSGNAAREASEFRPLVPHLDSSDSSASVMALKVTLFPNSGFCIGIATHHAVLDGKSSTMFMKAWAYLCRTTQEPPSLLTELEPFLDRSVVRDPNGLDIKYLNEWKWISELVDSNPTEDRSLKILPNISPHNKLVLATFELNRDDLEKLKKRVLSLWHKVDKVEKAPTKPLNLSTFVLASAFVFTCAGKAIIRSGTNNTDVAFGFSADCRSRLEPQVHSNYLGNCVFPCMINTEAEDFAKKDGVVIMAKKIHSTIRRLEKGVLDEVDTLFARWQSMAFKGTRGIAIGGFTRFGVYKTDFGWGRPVKVEIATVDINGLITMAEGRDGNGGVELGLQLYKDELDLFSRVFRDGIEGLRLIEFKN